MCSLQFSPVFSLFTVVFCLTGIHSLIRMLCKFLKILPLPFALLRISQRHRYICYFLSGPFVHPFLKIIYNLFESSAICKHNCCELITAKSVYPSISVKALHHALRSSLKQFIACRMPLMIIYLFQSIDIHGYIYHIR